MFKNLFKKKPIEPKKIVFDHWNAYPTMRDEQWMFVSFDEEIVSNRPTELNHCARIMIPIAQPNTRGGPVSPESELLWQMEDTLVAQLEKNQVVCRLIARLTYGGLREIVFQVKDWQTFRPIVGTWMQQHSSYDIDVSEHDGWDFFEDYISPKHEDRIYMLDRSVVNHLIDSGSNPEKEHALDYVFVGKPDALQQVIQTLTSKGYYLTRDYDQNENHVELTKNMPLDLELIVAESIANHALAESLEIECDGWGAGVVS